MKKEILPLKLLLLLILTSTIANAQWTPVAQAYGGTIANDGAVTFSINGKGYLIAGSTTTAYYEYDTLANTWTPLGNIPSNMGQAFAMSFVLNNKGYVIGGDTSGIPLSTVWEFDPTASNHWVQKNNFPGGVRDAGFAFSIGNYGYAGAGYDGMNIHDDIWKYDAPNDLWTQLTATLPYALLFPSSFVIGDNGYILTGGIPPSGVNETKKMWCLEGNTGTLTPKADFGGLGRSAAYAFSNNSYGFLGGGQTDFTTNLNDMWRYDPDLNSWSPAPAAPMLGSAWASTFVIGNTAYAGLGAKFVGTGLTGSDYFYKYYMDISTGIENPYSENPYSVFPNPATDYIRINSTTQIEKIKIFDINGKLIDEKLFPGENIYVGNLAPGFYTLTILDKKTNTSIKFIRE